MTSKTKKTKKKDPIKVLKKQVKALRAEVDALECAASRGPDAALDGIKEDLRVFQRKLRKQGKRGAQLADQALLLTKQVEAVRKMAVDQREKQKNENANLQSQIDRLEALITGPITHKIRSFESRFEECEKRDTETKAQLATQSRTIHNCMQLIDN